MSDRTPDLSHIDASGRARMVDVGDKEVTERTATAEAFVKTSPLLATAIRENALKKGNLLETARLAGIMAAKKTSELIPLCHPLPLDQADVTAVLEESGVRIRLTATVRTHAKTGVEMEALTAVTVAALTVVDMGKAIDKAMVIEGVRVLEKRGGRSGTYRAAP